ncbi:hypothetical protein ACFE04_031223 [Oxalis oulophora]
MDSIMVNGGRRRSSRENLEAATNQTIPIVDKECGGSKRRRGEATNTLLPDKEKKALNARNRQKNREKEKTRKEALEKEMEVSKAELKVMQRNITTTLSMLTEKNENLTSAREECKNKDRIIKDLNVQVESLKEFKNKWETLKQSNQLLEENKTLNRNYIATLEKTMETCKADHTKLLSTHNQTFENFISISKECESWKLNFETLKLKCENLESQINSLTLQLGLYEDIANDKYPSDLLLFDTDTNMTNPPQNQN